MRKDILLLLLFAVLLFQTRPAYAYIDPGSGSLILQIVIAGILGVIFTVKTFFRRLFPRGRLKSRNHNADSEDADNK